MRHRARAPGIAPLVNWPAHMRLRLFEPIDAREWLLIWAAAAVFASAFCYPMLCGVEYLGPGVSGWITTGPVFSNLSRFPANGDWDLFTELRWVPYFTVAHFHQLPFWNPYKCGGMAMLANPEAGIVTPFFLLYLLFGPHAGLHLEIVLHVALGFAGGWVLARVMGLSRVAAAVAATVFPASSWLYLHLSVGHLNFLSGVYLPWVAALLLEAIKRRSLFTASLGGLICALTFTEGNYPFLYAGIVIAVVSIVLSILERQLRPALTGFTLGLFALGFAALKIIPAWEMLAIYPRFHWGAQAHGWDRTLIYLFSRNQDLYRTEVSYFLFAEYGAYLSFAFAALAALGVVTALPWLIAGIIFVVLSRGDTGTYNLYHALKLLPGTVPVDIPARFIIGAVLCGGVLAALGADHLCRLPGQWGTTVAALLLVVGMAEAWTVGPPNLRYLFHNPVVPILRSGSFRQYWVANPGSMTEINEANMGSVNCQGYGYNDIPENARGYNEQGYKGEYYLLGAGRVSQPRWTPNRLSYDVDAAAPATLVINQNYFPGWRLESDSGAWSPHDGLLAVELPPGHHEVILVYRPQKLWLGLALTMFAAIAAVLLCRLEATD